MTFINFDPLSHRLRQPSGLRSLAYSVLGWLNGETITSKEDFLLDEGFAARCESFDLFAPHLISRRDIYVLDNRSGQLCDRVNVVAAAARSVTAFDSFEDAVTLALTKMKSNTLLVVNIDVFPDMEDAVETLLAAKNLLGNVPVVICSTTFAKNNFSLQRRAIADASLRLPCSDASLALALESGINNSQNRDS